jgi:hypothetical protein
MKELIITMAKLCLNVVSNITESSKKYAGRRMLSAEKWETQFSQWAQPPGDTEKEKIENAIRAVRSAMNDDAKLSTITKVYVQGSYRNRVNVRQESDVDIGVLYTGNSFFEDYPEGMSRSDFGNISGDLDYPDFKNMVESALVNKFGRASVKRGNKAFDIHANSYRIDADVVPQFIHRRYEKNGTYICGVQFYSDDGIKVINWPERVYDSNEWPDQHYENNVKKNELTSKRYKGVVRILKKLKYEMSANGKSSADAVPGFLIECLVWNVPNQYFMADTWYERLQNALIYIWSNTKMIETCNTWGEVSELKYIFRGSPISKLNEAHAFIYDAWSYVGVSP